jgi:transposase-like protein
MEGQKHKRRPNLSRMELDRIIQEYISGRKTGTTLESEYGLCRGTVNKIISRYRQKNSDNFATILHPIMPQTRVKTTDHSALQAENARLKRELELAQIKIEGYQIMGDILQEEYGIDLLKKVEAGQCPVLKKDTQK